MRRYHPCTEEHRPCHRLGVSLALPRYLCGMSEPRANLKRVQSLLKGDMDAFKPKFRQSVSTDVVLLDTVMRYILRRKGKQMRPMFIFLAANLCGGVSERSYRAANLIEMIHTATLVHDDIVDDANKRRGFFSVNALWKNKIAVLVGDFLLSKGMLLCIDNNDFDGSPGRMFNMIIMVVSHTLFLYILYWLLNLSLGICRLSLIHI